MAIYNQSGGRYEVYVYNVSSGGGNEENTADKRSVNPNTKKEAESTGDDKTSIAKSRKRQFALHTSRSAVNMLTRTLPNIAIGQIANLKGDTSYQAQVQRNYEKLGDVVNPTFQIVSTGVNLSLLGASGVLVGGAMAVAFAGQAVSLASKYEGRNIQYAITEFKQNASINYAKARSGIDITDGRARLR